MKGNGASASPESSGSNQEEIQVQGCPFAVQDSTVYLVRFVHTSEVSVCSYEEQPLRPGQEVIAPSRYGRDLARVLGPIGPGCARDSETVLPILRIAGEDDLADYDKAEELEASSLVTCRRKVDTHRLKMKVLSAHVLPEENKLLFFFTADGRVDFRELVRDLVATFRMRIELRQIGVRDETRLVGGVGICGRVLCCHSFPNQMCSVSIKMAKEQNLSLGSMKVSGPCGRLMCCLSYEYDFYSRERGRFPKHGTVVIGPSMNYLVSDVNLISGTVVLNGQEGGVVTLPIDSFRYDPESKRWSADVPPENNGREDP